MNASVSTSRQTGSIALAARAGSPCRRRNGAGGEGGGEGGGEMIVSTAPFPFTAATGTATDTQQLYMFILFSWPHERVTMQPWKMLRFFRSDLSLSRPAQPCPCAVATYACQRSIRSTSKSCRCIRYAYAHKQTCHHLIMLSLLSPRLQV